MDPETSRFLEEQLVILRSKTSGMRFTRVVVIGLGVLYLAYFFFYLFHLHLPLSAKLVHGYPHQADLLPGPFVSDRFGLSWFLLVVVIAQAPLPLLLVWTLKRVFGTGKRRVHLFFTSLFLLLMLALAIFVLVVRCFGCNNGTGWDVRICRDPRFCEAYGPTDACPAPSGPPLDPALLRPDPLFAKFLWFVLGFFGFNLFAWWQNAAEEAAATKAAQYVGY